MKHRCYDIVIENDNDEVNVPDEYVLDLPDVSLSNSLERQDFVGLLFESLVATSGLNVCSFRSEEVTK